MNTKIVSVIIPCYNGAQFLSEAIESALAQTYPPFEILVVDDGSTDNTGEVAARYQGVRYIRQENQGASIARNTGLSKSQGDYLVFLDHDDRILPKALEVGVNSLNQHPACGFVFGFSRSIRADGSLLGEAQSEWIETANYQLILSGRSLSPPATVMFRRAVFESVGEFDRSFDPAEDYEFYLRVARAFPIYCHNQIIVEYRRHDNNLSCNIPRILETTLKVIDAQWEFVKGNRDYEAAYRTGKKHWPNLFGPYVPYGMADHIKAGRFLAAARVMFLLLRHYPQGLVNYALELLSKLTKRFSSVLTLPGL